MVRQPCEHANNIRFCTARKTAALAITNILAKTAGKNMEKWAVSPGFLTYLCQIYLCAEVLFQNIRFCLAVLRCWRGRCHALWKLHVGLLIVCLLFSYFNSFVTIVSAFSLMHSEGEKFGGVWLKDGKLRGILLEGGESQVNMLLAVSST